MTNHEIEESGDAFEPPLSPALLDAAAAFNAPPDITPRDTIWGAIAARRSTVSAAQVVGVIPVAVSAAARTPSGAPTNASTTTSSLWRRWGTMALAASLIGALVLRTTQRTDTRSPTVSSVPDPSPSAVAWNVASTEHFGAAENALTAMNQRAPAERDAQLSAWSRDMLESTRLLMDSPAGQDAKRRALLLDLELLLVQLVESGPAMRDDDRTAMDDLLSRSALLLTRVRTTVPAGMSAQHD